jgi:molecular chaperone DnaK
MPQIEVTFDIDANGILHVSAKDKATGKENKIKIQASSGLTEEEVQRMVQDAELHAEEDKKAHELAEARNHCDGMIHTVKKSMTEYGKELSDEEKGVIEAAIKDAEEAIRENDVDSIKAKNEALATAAQKLGEKVYAKQQAEAAAAGGAEAAGAAPGAGAAGEAKKDEGDVVDAEYTEVNDKK